jgi:hypothetical protein
MPAEEMRERNAGMTYTAIAFTDEDIPRRIGEGGAKTLATLLHRLKVEKAPIAIIFYEGRPYSTWLHPDCEEVY